MVKKWLTRDLTFSLLGLHKPFSCPSAYTEKFLDSSGDKIQIQLNELTESNLVMC